MAEEIEVAGLVTKLSIDDTDLEKSMAELGRQMKLTQSEFKKASAGLADFGKSADGLKVKSDSLGKQLQTQGVIVAKLKQEYDKAKESGSKNAEQLNKMEIRLNKAAAEYNKLSGELTGTNTELAKQQKEIEIANSNWTKLSNSLDAAGKKMQDAGKQISDAGKGLTAAVTLPLVAIGGLATKVAIDFESAFAGVRKTVNATEAEFAVLETGIRNMAKEIPASATEIARVAEAAGQLGVQKSAILGFTRTMVDLGNTTNLTSDQAATALARLANITQMPQDQFDRLGATVVALGNKLATTEAEIVEMGLRLAGAGKQIGLSEAQILGFAGALSSVGIEAEAGGSAFSRVMIDIAQAAATGSKDLNTFAAVAGQSSADFRKSFQEDAAGAIVSFVEGLGRMSESGQNTFGVLDELGLSEIRVRDALLRTSNAGDLLRESIDLGSQAWKDNTALTNEAEQRYNTTASKLQVLKNRLTDVGITLGDALIPALLDAVDAMEPLFKSIENTAKWFSELDASTQKTVVTVAAFVTALGPVLFAVGKAVLLIGRITSAFAAASAATAAAGTATAAAGASFAAVTGPVGIAIAAILALIAAGVALYNFFSKDAVPPVKRFGDEAQGAAQKASGSFAKFRQDAKGDLEKTSETAKVEGAKIGENIATGIGKGTGKAKDTAVADMREMIDRMKDEVDRNTASLERLGDAIASALKKQYAEMEKVQTDALDMQVEAERDASNERLKIYDKEYLEKLKLIDKEAYDQIKALQDQIDSIDDQTDAEEKALKEQEYQTRLAELQKQLAAAETADERERIQKQISDIVTAYERQQLLEQRKVAKESLKDQIDVAKEAADEKRIALRQEIEDKKQAEQDKLTALLEGLADDKQAIQEHFAELSREENLQAEARKLVITKNNDEIIRLLKTYNPKWQDAGQGFADSFVNGLNSEKQTIEEAVKSAISLAPAIDDQVKEVDRLQGKLKELEKQMQDFGGGGGGGFNLDPAIEQTKELSDTIDEELTPAMEGVSKTSKEMEIEALKAFLGLNDKATVQLKRLKWSGETITEETAATIVDTFYAMGNTITENLESSQADQLRTLETFFEKSNALTEEEEAKALQQLAEQQQKEAEELEKGKIRVAEIFSKALDDHRALTQQEWDEVNRIQGEMTDTAERTLGEHELAQKTILEQMKADAENITARQAADVVKNSKKQKDEAIAEAEEQYDKVVAEIIRQRDESKTISAEQADALIADAKRQRDESVKHAEEMHKDVVEEARKQASEHLDNVDWETGEVLSKWDTFKNDWKAGWKIFWDKFKEDSRNFANAIISIPNGIIKAFETMVNSIVDLINSIPSIDIPDILGGGTISLPKLEKQKAVYIPYLEEGAIVTGPTLAMIGEGDDDEAVTPIKKLLSMIQIAVNKAMANGGLADMDRRTAAVAFAAQKGMSSVSMPMSGGAGSGSHGVASSPQILNFEGMFSGANFHVRSDSDIKRIAEELYWMQRNAARGMGVT